MSRNQSFFHGTSAEIPIGGEILPGNKVGVPSKTKTSGGHRDADRVFTTTDEKSAWAFAELSARRTRGRARVYEVAPHPEQMVGLFNDKHETFSRPTTRGGQRRAKGNYSEYHAPSYTVTGRFDIKPGHQGTLPLNWRQFAEPGIASVADVNHPSPPARKRPVSLEPSRELPGQGRLL